MKKKLLIYSILGYLLFIGYKFFIATKYLIFKFYRIELPDKDYKQLINDWALGQAQLKLFFDLQNYSALKFRVKEQYLELYTTDGRYIASPSTVKINSIIIQPQKDNIISLTYDIDLVGVYKLLENVSISQAFRNYKNTGTFGVKILVQGFIKIAGIPFKIPIRQIITI